MGAKLSYPRVVFPSTHTVVVTGGNTGIGYETAKAIAQMGARVVIACRTEQRALEAIERMQTEHKESVSVAKTKQNDECCKKEDAPASAVVDAQTAEGNITSQLNREPSCEEHPELLVEFMKLDLGSLKSTMEFIEEFKRKGYPLHVLICNAGIANAPQGYTEDGHENHFQVNYLSHLLIILHLLPVMRRSGPDVRIVQVSSIAHKFDKLHLDNMDGKTSYNRFKFYCKSKLYQVMAMYALQRRLEKSGITVTSLHPGQVETEIFRNFQDSLMWRTYLRAARGLGTMRSPVDGAATSIKCAVDPELAGVGAVYFNNCQLEEPASQARDEKNQEELLQYSLKCLENYLTEDILQEFPIAQTTEADDSAGERTCTGEKVGGSETTE